MDIDLCGKIRDRFKRSEFWTGRSKDTGTYLHGLKCPECGQPEAWVYAKSPFTLICNRTNECGAKTKSLNLFPELIQRIEKEYPPVKQDPYRPARVYLQSRSLGQSLEGLNFRYKRKIRKTASGGVLFLVGFNAQGEKVWNGRLFNPPAGEGKTHNQGSTAGMFWKHSKLPYDPGKPTFITEGIIDALSLIEMGYQAIAVLSSGQDPSKINLGELSKNIVIAFDPDSAGAGGLKKWKAVYSKAKAITPIKGDWNDLLCSMPLDIAQKFFKDKYKEFETKARLLLALNAGNYASIYKDFYEYAPGLFPFNGCLWFSYIKPATKNEPEHLVTAQAGNFTLRVDHYQLDTSIPDEPTNRYHLKVYPRKGRPVFSSVTGAELSAPGSLRSMFLTRFRVLWKGENKASIALAEMIVEAGAPVVRQLQIMGHDLKSNFFVFKDFAIDPAGKAVQPDEKGFFRTSPQEYLRPASQISTRPQSGTDPVKIYNLINAAWPQNGPLVIAFTVASWFVNIVKSKFVQRQLFNPDNDN